MRNLMRVAVILAALTGCGRSEPYFDDRPDGGPHRKDGSVGLSDAGRLDGSVPGDAGAPDGGDPFCSGSTSKVLFHQQLSSPVAATSSLIAMNCCEGVSITLHTSSILGALTNLDIISQPGQGLPLGTTLIGDDFNQPVTAHLTVGATYYGSGISAAGLRMYGDIDLARSDSSKPLHASLCLTLKGFGEATDGTRFFVPDAVVMPYGWENRLAIHLLSNRSLNAFDAASSPLDSLALDPTPLVNLYGIRYYRASDAFVAFDLSANLGGMQSRIGTVGVLGTPFVVVADGARIYLGAFWTAISSIAPNVPSITIENVTAQGATIHPSPTPPDPRSDPRILTALRESGKLAP